MTPPLLDPDEQPGRFFDRAPTLLATLSPDGVLLALNARWEGRFGYSRDELRSRFLVELVSEHDRVKLRDALKSLGRALSLDLELTLRSKYGTGHALRWTLQWGAEDAVIYASAQELGGRAHTPLDELRTYEQLRQSTGLDLDELLRVWLHYDALTCTILNPDGSVRFESPAGERMFGQSSPSLHNRPLQTLIHPQDRPRWLEFVQLLLTQELPHDQGVLLRRYHELGHWVPCLTRGWPIYRGPELHSVVLLTCDQTQQHHERQLHEAALKELEAQLAASSPPPGARLYHSTPMGLLSLTASLHKDLSEQLPMGLIAFSGGAADPSPRFHWANQAARGWLGLDQDELDQGFGPALLGEDFARACQETLVAQDARLCMLVAPPSSTSPLRAPLEGLLFGLGATGVGVVFQTSLLHDPSSPQSPLELIEEHLDSQERDRHRGYLFDWNHELRTPLNAILGYSELLQEELDGAAPAPVLEDLRKIQYAARYLNALISNFVALRRQRAGKSNVFLESVEVRDVLDELSQQLEPTLKAHSTPFELNAPARLGSIYTDRGKLQQVLLNLLYFMHRHARATIHMRVRRMRDAVAFSLTTSLAEGLPAHVEAILNAEPMPRGAETIKGPLLGVLIAQEWTRHMGGRFLYEHTSGGGLALTVAMPTQVEWTPDDSRELLALSKLEQPEVTEATLERMAEGHPSVILIIDDDPAIHEVISRYLSRHSYHVASALNGQRGLEMARHLAPNAIILDVVMPNMDGWSVLSHLKSDPALSHIPVAIQSIIQDRELAQSLGAAAHLSKPMERAAVLQFIERHHWPERLVSLWCGEPGELRERLRERSMRHQPSQWLDADTPSHVAELIKLYRPNIILWPAEQPGIPLDSLVDTMLHFQLQRSTLLVLGAAPAMGHGAPGAPGAPGASGSWGLDVRRVARGAAPEDVSYVDAYLRAMAEFV